MNWNFTELARPMPRETVFVTIEGGTHAWLRRFAAERNITRAIAMRGLVTQAVRFWQKTRQPLARRQEYPWAEFATRGMKTRMAGITLDPPILVGLREISEITGKTMSRIVSEILLDAMNAQAAMVAEAERSRKIA
jgi:hypothetical protein